MRSAKILPNERTSPRSRVAIGDYPHTLPLKRGEITSPSLKLDFVDVKPMHTAFKPMVREHAYDASEMALVTYLQAKAYNKGLTLLPAAMLARFQHHTMLFNAERGKITPANLPGKRIGVRAYSQTTAGWVRGILQNDYGVDFSPRAVGHLRGRARRRSQGPARRHPRAGRQGHHANADRWRARRRDLRRGDAERHAACKASFPIRKPRRRPGSPNTA